MHLLKRLIFQREHFFVIMLYAVVWTTPTYGTSESTTPPPSQSSLKESLLNAGSSLLEKVGKEWDKVEEKVGHQIDKVGENIKKAFPREKEQSSTAPTSAPSVPESMPRTRALPSKDPHGEHEKYPPTKIHNFLHGIAMEQLDLSDVVDQASAAIVNIHVKYNRLYTHPFFSDPFFRAFFGHNLPAQNVQEQAIGSGTIVRKDGIILTCAHVVEGGDSIIVQLHNGKRFPARVIFMNKKEDIAFLKINTQAQDKDTQTPGMETFPLEFPTLSLAEKEEPKVGRFILAMGYPQGQRLVTFGMISSLGEVSLVEGGLPHDHVITVTAEMGPGMSGGALVNLKGELVGIPNAIMIKQAQLTKHGIAIPVGVALKYLRTMDDDGTVKQPWHGMDVKPVRTSMQRLMPSEDKNAYPQNTSSDQETVLMVVHVEKESPVANAGLKEGDILESINGKNLKHLKDFKHVLSILGVGESVTLLIKRSDAPLTLSYTVEAMPHDAMDHVLLTKGALKGVRIRMLKSDQGAEIMDISPATPASSFGLERGDVILRVNKNPIRSLNDFEKIDPLRFSMDVQRGDQSFSVMMNMGPRSKL